MIDHRPVFCVFFVLIGFCSGQTNFLQLKNDHVANQLVDGEIVHLANLSNKRHIERILDNILITRVVGTPNHDKVLKYIVRELENLKWNVELDEFEDETPNFGRLTFTNIVATLNPNAERFLVLACHYDSKYFAQQDFVGATDSAVPCAMMLNLAAVMKNELEQTRNNKDLGLKLIFFDGEEAFEQWGPKDSIYGARHLAKAYKSHTHVSEITGETINDLQRIDVLVLLDLLGGKNPKFYSFFEDTEKWYVRLVAAEECLARLGLLRDYSGRPQDAYFQKRVTNARIEDDHLPFLSERVPILHLITIPFPKFWHTPRDSRAAVDLDTVENLNKILRVFVAEYLHLSVTEDLGKEKTPEKEL